MIKEKINEYLNSQKVQSLAPTTREGYTISLNDLRKFCEASSGITEVRHIESHMPALAKALKARKISDQTIYQKFTGIKIFLKWAGRPSQYTFSISNKGKKAFKLKHARRWLSQDEIAQCRAYFFPRSANPTRDRLITALLIETGCRARELAVLRGTDIDMAAGTLFLSDSKTEPRPAFFSKETHKLMVARQSEVGKKAWLSKTFPDVGRVQEIVNGMLKDLGFKNGRDGRGAHTFRHYTASYLFFIGGVKIEDVAVLLGDSADTIRNVYLHCPVDVLRKRIRVGMGWK